MFRCWVITLPIFTCLTAINYKIFGKIRVRGAAGVDEARLLLLLAVLLRNTRKTKYLRYLHHCF